MLKIVTPVEEYVYHVPIDEATRMVVEFVHSHDQHDDIDAYYITDDTTLAFDFETETF